uniref:HzNVORF9-like2 protein n=1 Tax=Chelonus inanitus TaxID=49201 RepID=B9W4B5_9HYME|nr:HzNVORF9-like2 protein [Chelonus inanitus]
MSTLRDPNDAYLEISRVVDVGEGALKKIYTTDKAAFDVNIIQKIISFCYKKEYGLLDLLDLSDVLKLTIFRQYSQETNVDQLNILEKYIDIYLLAICKYKSQNSYLVRNKLLPLLRVRTKPPFCEPDVIAKGKVSLKQNIRCTKNLNNRKNVDLAQTIRIQQFHIRNASYEQLNFIDRSNVFRSKQFCLDGDIICNIASVLLSLQTIILKCNQEMGFKVNQFLEVNIIEWDI